MSQLSTYLAKNLSLMQPKDILLVRHFEKSSSILASDIIRIIESWGQGRKSNETILEFLIRKGVLTKEAEFAFRLILKGRLHTIDAIKLFASDGLKLLRSKDGALYETSKTQFRKGPPNSEFKKSSSEELKNFASSIQDLKIKNRQENTRERRGSPKQAERVTPLNKEISNLIGNTKLPKVPSPKLGSVFGDCLITSKILINNSCCVFKAFHQSLKMPVALKIYRTGKKQNSKENHEGFQKEAASFLGLKHPNIVQLLEYRNNDHVNYIVMEFVDGLSLLHLINQSGCLQPYFAIEIILKTAMGLGFFHDRDITHGRISPKYILSSKNGHVKISCNELVKISYNQESNLMSQDNKGWGSQAIYGAPEQFLNAKEREFRSDIYSLGATLYHALTGKPPFSGASNDEIIHNHIHQPLISAKLIKDEISRDVSDLIDKMMAKNPLDRYQKMDELISDIEKLLRGMGNPNGGKISKSKKKLKKLH